MFGSQTVTHATLQVRVPPALMDTLFPVTLVFATLVVDNIWMLLATATTVQQTALPVIAMEMGTTSHLAIVVAASQPIKKQTTN